MLQACTLEKNLELLHKNAYSKENSKTWMNMKNFYSSYEDAISVKIYLASMEIWKYRDELDESTILRLWPYLLIFLNLISADKHF